MIFSFLTFPNSSYRSLQARVCWQRAVATDTGAQPGYLQWRPSGVCPLVWNMGGSIIIYYNDLTVFHHCNSFLSISFSYWLVNYYCSARWVCLKVGLFCFPKSNMAREDHLFLWRLYWKKNIRKWIIFHCHVWVGFFDWDNNNNNNNMFKTNNMPFGCIWKWSLYPTMATQYVGKMMIEPRPTDSGVCLDHSLRIEQSHSYGDGNVINGPFHTGISRGVRVWCSRVCLAAWSFLVIWIFGIWVCPIAEYIPNPMCLPSCLYHHAPNLMDTTVTKLHRGATILGDSLRFSLYTGSLI